MAWWSSWDALGLWCYPSEEPLRHILSKSLGQVSKRCVRYLTGKLRSENRVVQIKIKTNRALSWEKLAGQEFVNLDRWLGSLNYLQSCLCENYARCFSKIDCWGHRYCKMKLRREWHHWDRFATTSFASEFHFAIWKGLEVPASLWRSKKHWSRTSSCCYTYDFPDPVKLY